MTWLSRERTSWGWGFQRKQLHVIWPNLAGAWQFCWPLRSFSAFRVRPQVMVKHKVTDRRSLLVCGK